MTSAIDVAKIVSDADADLSHFVAQLSSLSRDHLIQQMMISIELEGEEEDAFRALSYRKQVALIEAIGRFRFHDFDDAAAKAAE